MKGLSTVTWWLTAVILAVAGVFVFFILFATIGGEAPSGVSNIAYGFFDSIVGSLPGVS